MRECESCGASVDNGEDECPYCGHSFIKHASITKPGRDVMFKFSIDNDEGRIHFGDGMSGARPGSGRANLSARYEYGGGSEGNLICPNCQLENDSTRDECEACGTPLKKP
ncbi:MAG: hypothetical protein AM325_016230 [Candidatus Thorarchaeota archaeon SMTZ1-45]|nr:MAG: hypothetical protein AM325_16970 [Candidatus Thorarchaeota archaeon SMTZ1-45]